MLLITNLLRLNNVFLPPFFLSLFFLLSRKECNYCVQVQGYQKILNNPQLRGLKNAPHRVGTINLKLENWINASLHIGTLRKISFKNLTPGLCIFNYGNYKFYTEYKTYTIFKINLEKQPPELLFTKRCSCRFCKFNRKTSVLESLLKKVAGLKPEGLQLYEKMIPTDVFLWNFWNF